jgi:hypothetical protein
MTNYINPDNSHNTGFFSDNTISRYGLPAASNNVDAAAGKVSCQNGGASRGASRKILMAKSHKKINKRKIKNISNMYKMKSRRHTKRMKRMLRSRASRRRRGTRRYISRKQRGGMYQQYGSNIANSPGYTLNTNVPSALANPMPIKSINDCGDVNHFNNPATNSNAGSMLSNLKNWF